MINDLVNLVQQVAGSSITNNPEIPSNQHHAVIQSAAEGIFKGLQSQATGGGLNQIIGMLTSPGGSKGISSALTQNVQSSVVSSLMDQAGIKSSLAKTIAASLVPTVLGALSKHTADPNNSTFNVGNILSSLTGGKTNGVDVQGLLDKFAGGADGKFDLSDVANMLGKGANGKSSGIGGLLGSLGGLFGGK